MNRVSNPLASLKLQLLELLDAKTAESGLTCGQLVKAAPLRWRRDLSAALGNGSHPADAEGVRALIYRMWSDGEVFVEPPREGEKSIRVWHPQHARRRFPAVTQAGPEETGADSVELLREAYNAFLPEHPSKAVNIFKIRRRLGWNRRRFDALLEELSSRKKPLVDLIGGDPSNFNESERDDSYSRRGELFFSILWRT